MRKGPQLQVSADRLRLRRAKLPMTQHELARKAGISVQRIKQLEASQNSGIRPSTARQLAKALKCSVDEIVEIVEASA